MNTARKIQQKQNKTKPKIQKKNHTTNSTDKVINFYRKFGNQNLIQKKITVEQANDKYEQEADRVAEKVVSNNEEKKLQQKPIFTTIQRKETDEDKTQLKEEEEKLQTKEDEEEKIQTKEYKEEIKQKEELEEKNLEENPILKKEEENKKEEIQRKIIQFKEPIQRKTEVRFFRKSNTVSPEIEQEIKFTKSLGNPLDKKVRNEFEPKFGVSFKDVKIHTGSYSVSLNKKLNSQAFTYGKNIYFGAGKYNPETISGKKLLAHELTHVVQQRGNHLSKYSVSPTKPKIQKFSLRKAWGWIKKTVKKGIDAIKDLGKKIANLAGEIKKAILKKLASFVQKIPGFSLLVFILGKNPVTDEPVERNFGTFIEAIIDFIPGAKAFIERIKEAKILQKAGEWFSKEFKKLNLSWGYLKGLFKKAWDSLTVGDIKNPEGAFQKLKAVFSPALRRLFNFVKNLIQKIPQFIFETILAIAKAPVKLIMGILNKGRNVFNQILSDPIGFLRNLINAVKSGFFGFFKRIKKYLIKGLFSWLFGTLEKAGLKMPEKFDLKGIFSIIMQILGLTYQKIREKLVKRIGEEKVQKLESTFEFIKSLKEKGTKGIVEFISEKFGNFLETIKEIMIQKIRNWVITKIIEEAIAKLAKLWNPVGAIIEAIQNIYRLIMFFWENAKRIAAVVHSIFNSIAEIALGKIKKAALWIERTLGRTVPIVISFFARMIGLGGISKTIRNIIKKIQDRVDKLLDKAVDWVVKKASKLWIVRAGKKALGKAREFKEKAVEKSKAIIKKGKTLIKEWWKKRISIRKKGKTYEVYLKGKDGKIYIKSSPEREITYHPLFRDNAEIKKEYANLLAKIRNKEELTPEEENKIQAFLETIKTLIETEEVGETKIGFGGLYKGKFGTLAYAEKLTSKISGGSSPTVENDIWNILKQRRTSANSKDYYYVRGHLLNEKLGGTGKDWKNLTPLTQSANNRSEQSHFHKVEKKLQEIKKENSNIKYINYYVHAEYGRQLPKNYNSAPEKIKEIMKAEEFVPFRLITIADIYGKNNKQIDKIREPIENNIDQEINSYHFENEELKEININRASASTISNFLRINRNLAERIIDERKKAKFETFEEFKQRMKTRKEKAEKLPHAKWHINLEEEFKKIEAKKEFIKVA